MPGEDPEGPTAEGLEEQGGWEQDNRVGGESSVEIIAASDCVVEDLERTGVLPPTLFRWKSPFTLFITHSNKK